MAKLLIIEETQSLEFPISKKITVIGRAPEATVVIQEKRASKLHCQIIQEADQFFLVDLASSNGTRLNGQKVTRSLLHHHDEIRIGSTKLIFSNTSFAEEALEVPILNVPRAMSSVNSSLHPEKALEPENKNSISKRAIHEFSKERKYLNWIGLSLLFVFGMWWMSPNSSPREESTSLLANFSFEQTAQQLPKHWSFTGSLPAQVTLDPVSAPHGQLSLKIETQEGKNDSYLMARSDPISIKEFQAYEATLKTQFERGIAVGIWFTYRSEKTQIPNWEEYHLVTQRGNWRPISFSSRAPENMTHLTLGLVVFGPKALVRFDQVELKTSENREVFPKIYQGGAFSVLVSPKGRLELRWKEKVIFSQLQWWIQSSETLFSQAQMNVTSWSHTVRRFDLSGELFDFTQQKKFPFQFSLQNTSSYLLLEYTIDASWQTAPYLPYLKGILSQEAILILENEVQSGNFEVSQTQQFLFQGDEKEDIFIECSSPVRVQGERDLTQTFNSLTLYPQQSQFSLKFLPQEKEKKDITWDWVTATAQYQKGYFGKANVAFQKVLSLLSKNDPRYQEAQEKMQQIEKKCEEVLREAENAIMLLKANPSETEQKKQVEQLQEKILRFSPLPIEKELLLYLKQIKEFPLEASPVEENRDIVAEKLFQLGQQAYQAKEFFKAKVYWNALLKDYDPKQHWQKQLQSTLVELDRHLAQKLEENK